MSSRWRRLFPALVVAVAACSRGELSADTVERYVESAEDDMLPDDEAMLEEDGGGRSWNDLAKKHGFKDVAELKAVAKQVQAQQKKLPPKVQERLKVAKQKKKAATSSPPK